jgi:hypothetical protein
MRKFTIKIVTFFLLLLVLNFFLSKSAQAVPSFKRQTGVSCSACHTLFPELTPFGRNFKLHGYVQSINNNKPYEPTPPISIMAQASYTDAQGLNNGVAPFNNNSDHNDKINIPQQVSLFYGGRIYSKTGALLQLTYNGISNNLSMDNGDIRFVDNLQVGGKTLIYGLTVNNNPTAQDVWNTTPAWGFPFASSAVANMPAAHAVIDGSLAQQVGGIGAYGYWNELLYGEVSVYRTNRNGINRPLGAGVTTSTITDGAVPYWRLALQKQWKEHSFSFGTYGLVADIYPSGAMGGPTDRFTDTALDAQYQFVGQKHIVTVASTWIHEKQDWNASSPLGITANSSDYLDTLRINVNYYYRAKAGTFGGAVRYFSTTGGSDPALYTAAPVTGSNSGSPDSSGFLVAADYLPIDNVKLSLQYTLYDKFNGGRSNYDGYGRNASDNNTLYFVVWVAF